MLIRPALLADLSVCLALDANSQTNHVWQMDAREENGGTVVGFHTVRLPRIMRVVYPRQREDLLACWEEGVPIFVATDERADERPIDEGTGRDTRTPQLFGYCQLDIQPWQQAGWISHLIVDRPFRRQGIGTAMLRTCIAWGKVKKLTRLMVAVQTKNFPGISFCEKHGFVFCGFHDHYFVNRDIALFYSLNIRT